MIDKLLFIATKFLLIVNKPDKSIKERSILIVLVIVFLNYWFAVTLIYMLLISKGIVTFNKNLYIFVFAFSVVTTYYLLNKKYSKNYDNVINELNNKPQLESSQTVVLFLFLYVLPFLLCGIGLLLLKQGLYR